ncbi:hypothetical protein H4684_001485 [Desulfomicrobium macestii]|uniref:Uncharacterized protein n=1 Tax=Desulfomicrobium macestii TaxID=90731 RepID=A0ABR9H2A8_9BACT|nr:hypothetical protein [Desulfomicrobium macestii]MBE1424846.1 hypothetical protein [Desulfomicrobium macestii]
MNQDEGLLYMQAEVAEQSEIGSATKIPDWPFLPPNGPMQVG